MMRVGPLTASLVAIALTLTSCGGGNSSGTTPNPTPSPTPNPAPPPPGGNYTPPAAESLSITDVQTVIAQAVSEAQNRNLPSVIAVVDRVGNVLAVFRMNGARATAITSRQTEAGINNPPIDAQGVEFPAEIGAIAKAVTGAYLSSGGNAFSTRTASQIVQQHFPPAPNLTPGLESGPLFGVQFSQLPCSDFNTRFMSAGGPAALIGPKRSPLGLAADPGGLPLYKNGVIVGAIGVMGDGDYGFDPDSTDIDDDDEEAIALAGLRGFAPPVAIRADRIPVDGTSLRFTDVQDSDLGTISSNFAAINGTAGTLIAVRGYAAATIISGSTYGTEASGIRASRASEFSNSDAFVMTDGSGNPRFPIRGGTDGADVQALTANEARAILEEAFIILTRARAQIRRPLNSRMQATISLVDTHGQILGMVRSPDAPIFGADVSLQKARTATFLSSANAAAGLSGNPDPGIAGFVQRVRTFLNDPQALTGAFAITDRAVGNLARPYFPDGELGRPPGPLSRPIEDFNPFATGLQVALVAGNIVRHAQFVAGVAATDTPQRCTNMPDVAAGQNPIENGIQIFPGSVPVYRGNRLVGGIGVSGDGIDQDDMVSFFGLHNASVRLGNSVGNAPRDIRSDRIVVNVAGREVRLRYVRCPVNPFVDTNEQLDCLAF